MIPSAIDYLDFEIRIGFVGNSSFRFGDFGALYRRRIGYTILSFKFQTSSCIVHHLICFEEKTKLIIEEQGEENRRKSRIMIDVKIFEGRGGVKKI